MKYHLILTLALGLALPTIALAKEKGTNATADEATFKKSNRRYSTAYSNPIPQPPRNT
jgi:hypothetical protein